MATNRMDWSKQDQEALDKLQARRQLAMASAELNLQNALITANIDPCIVNKMVENAGEIAKALLPFARLQVERDDV